MSDEGGIHGRTRAPLRASIVAPLSTPMRVLLVDEDASDRDRFRRLVLRSGLDFDLEEATTLEDAERRIRARRFDCVIVDYGDREHDGVALLRVARSSTPPCPVIVLTRSNDARVAVAAMREGAYDFFSKQNLRATHLRTSIDGCAKWAKSQAEVASTHERAHRLSFYDGVTGLPNRNLLFDRIDQAVATASRIESRFAVMMLDLDRFKDVNDVHGHAVGDALLAAVGDRFEAISRRSDTFARVGGDEFASLLTACESAEGALQIARKIEAVVRAPFAIEGAFVHIGVSIGVALYPDHGTDRERLLANADHAMYVAKRAGGGSRVCAHEVGSRDEERTAQISRRLEAAVAERRIRLVFQPIVEIATGRTVAMEALVRFSEPELATMPVKETLALAERGAFVETLGAHILELALDQASLWQAAGHRFSLSVNVSGRFLSGAGLVDRLREALHKRALDPRLLTFDVAENILMSNGGRGARIVRELRELGVGVAIDDFGTGFTSLRLLRELDVTQIKIDPEFTRTLTKAGRDAAIVRSITELARGIGAQVVAEGVEDPAVLALLGELGCDLVQGYAMAHPMRASEVPRWLDAHGTHIAPPPSSVMQSRPAASADRRIARDTIRDPERPSTPQHADYSRRRIGESDD